MKVRRSSVMLLIVLFVAFSTMAFVPMSAPGIQAPEPTVLDVILRIAVGFASLAGVAGLVAVLVQIFKLVGLVKDGTAGQWTAGFNLIAFIALVYFGVFQPTIPISVLDGYATQIAQIALFVIGFMVQMTTSKPVYASLKHAQVPLLGYSFTKA
jgi:hypothetical protein